VGKLSGTITYLVGSIDDSEDFGVGWRKKITPLLKEMGIIVLDPTNKPTNDFFEDKNSVKYFKKLKQDGKFEQLRKEGRIIRNFDLRCCDKADFIIAYLDFDKKITGSYEEIFRSNMSKKPILIFAKQGKAEIPNWLYWTLDINEIFENMGEVVQYLNNINDEIVTPNQDRWRFFNWTKLLSK